MLILINAEITTLFCETKIDPFLPSSTFLIPMSLKHDGEHILNF